MEHLVLVSNHRHMRPMHAVLERHKIGIMDKYRGIWIKQDDLPEILTVMRSEPSCQQGGEAEWDVLCDGSNIHNTVWFTEYLELFDLKEMPEEMLNERA